MSDTKRLEIAEAALKEIVDPIPHMKRESIKRKKEFNIYLAKLLSTDHEYLQNIAAKALLQMDDLAQLKEKNENTN